MRALRLLVRALQVAVHRATPEPPPRVGERQAQLHIYSSERRRVRRQPCDRDRAA